MVYQSYKSLVNFATCWLTLIYCDLKFTWWGTLGAAIWVTNGTVAIVAIQKAGLGISQALWSAISIFVAFIAGVWLFNEPVKNLGMAIVGMPLRQPYPSMHGRMLYADFGAKPYLAMPEASASHALVSPS